MFRGALCLGYVQQREYPAHLEQPDAGVAQADDFTGIAEIVLQIEFDLPEFGVQRPGQFGHGAACHGAAKNVRHPVRKRRLAMAGTGGEQPLCQLGKLPLDDLGRWQDNFACRLQRQQGQRDFHGHCGARYGTGLRQLIQVGAHGLQQAVCFGLQHHEQVPQQRKLGAHLWKLFVLATNKGVPAFGDGLVPSCGKRQLLGVSAAEKIRGVVQIHSVLQTVDPAYFTQPRCFFLLGQVGAGAEKNEFPCLPDQVSRSAFITGKEFVADIGQAAFDFRRQDQEL